MDFLISHHDELIFSLGLILGDRGPVAWDFKAELVVRISASMESGNQDCTSGQENGEREVQLFW